MPTATWGTYTARNRQTGSVVTIADNREGQTSIVDIEDDPEAKWITACDTHNTFVTSPTRAAAYAAMVTPWDWCEDCAASQDFEQMGAQDDKYVGPIK